MRTIEPKLDRRPEKPDPIGTPDIVLLQSEEIAIVDNLAGKLYLVVYADPRNPHAYAHGRERLRQLLAALREPVAIPPHGPVVAHQPQSGFGEASFLAAVAKAKRYVFDGDIMQVQISQRLSRRFAGEPLALYRALRTLNPSPYMFFFDFRDFHVVGASPEILVRLEGDKVTLRPIAGTRRRGATPEEDHALAEELLADPKERAEHVMLIDLGRNDVGRIAETGTVRVTDTMVIERYSHVMHIVSNVGGTAEARARRARGAACDLSRRHRHRRAEGARDGDHRRAGAGEARRSTPARSATSAITATWTSRSRSAPRC